LKKLEEENDIKIIYAVEAGSRAWHLESEDSDYDIRFIYVQNNTKKYLSLTPLKETLDGFSADRLYDWQGWDIKKALKLINQINPSIVEWLYSPIVYHQSEYANLDFVSQAKSLLKEQKRITPLLYHYRSMAKTNFKTHIENKKEVKIKKYLYVIRPVGMYLWLLNKNGENCFERFEIDFTKILEEIKDQTSEECYKNIQQIIVKKKEMKEMDDESRIKCIDEWIENILISSQDEIKEFEIKNLVNDKKQIMDSYDDLLHSLLGVRFD
jgi:predicted nucleotidyltransferase